MIRIVEGIYKLSFQTPSPDTIEVFKRLNVRRKLSKAYWNCFREPIASQIVLVLFGDMDLIHNDSVEWIRHHLDNPNALQAMLTILNFNGATDHFDELKHRSEEELLALVNLVETVQSLKPVVTQTIFPLPFPHQVIALNQVIQYFKKANYFKKEVADVGEAWDFLMTNPNSKELLALLTILETYGELNIELLRILVQTNNHQFFYHTLMLLQPQVLLNGVLIQHFFHSTHPRAMIAFAVENFKKVGVLNEAAWQLTLHTVSLDHHFIVLFIRLSKALSRLSRLFDEKVTVSQWSDYTHKIMMLLVELADKPALGGGYLEWLVEHLGQVNQTLWVLYKADLLNTDNLMWLKKHSKMPDEGPAIWMMGQNGVLDDNNLSLLKKALSRSELIQGSNSEISSPVVEVLLFMGVQSLINQGIFEKLMAHKDPYLLHMVMIVLNSQACFNETSLAVVLNLSIEYLTGLAVSLEMLQTYDLFTQEWIGVLLKNKQLYAGFMGTLTRESMLQRLKADGMIVVNPPITSEKPLLTHSMKFFKTHNSTAAIRRSAVCPIDDLTPSSIVLPIPMM